jgi:hypothetical protein
VQMKLHTTTTNKRPLRSPVSVRNPLTLLLFWASKTDPRLAAVCSRWAIATQAAFGVLVLFTTALAFCSAYYTLSTLGVSDRWLPWIAGAYTVFIFTIDREIVGGLDRATAFVRPVLALFIGMVVAVPVELWIFQDRIDQELAKQYRQNNREQFDRLRDGEARMEKRRVELEAMLADLRNQESDWGRVMDDELVGRPKGGRTGIGGAGPVFENARTQQEAVRQQIEEMRRDLGQLERTVTQERQRLEREFQRQEVGKVTSFTTRYEALQDVIHGSPALYRLSWGVTLFLVFLEMSGALMKLLTPHVDYHHLVNAEIQENVLRIDEIAFRNYEQAKNDPTKPQLSVAEKFASVRFAPVLEVKSKVDDTVNEEPDDTAAERSAGSHAA